MSLTELFYGASALIVPYAIFFFFHTSTRVFFQTEVRVENVSRLYLSITYFVLALGALEPYVASLLGQFCSTIVSLLAASSGALTSYNASCKTANKLKLPRVRKMVEP
jgi:hypothetical protein